MIPVATRRKFLVAFAIVAAILIGMLVLLRAAGLLKPYSIPSNGMAPAIRKGDSVVAEGVTYLFRKPARGDILVFKTDGLPLPGEQAGSVYCKRLVGLPGEKLRFTGGKLYVNDVPVALGNRDGEIDFEPYSFTKYLATGTDSFVVPEGQYFVIGDNLNNSSDSRLWGPLPVGNVLGRVIFCYWPRGDVGSTK